MALPPREIYTVDNPANNNLRSSLLHQPDTFTAIGHPDIINNDAAPWFETPFAPTLIATQMEVPIHERTFVQIISFIK
jgi:hypothetical protein